MKNIIIVLLLTVAVSTHVAAQSLLKVSTTDKQAINVALDGRYFNTRGTSVTVGDLPPGRHFLQIYGVVKKRNGKLREAVIYEGDVATHGGMITLLEYDPVNMRSVSSEVAIDEYTKNNPLPAGAPDNRTYDMANNNTNNAPQNDGGNNADNTQNANDNNDGSPVASPVSVDNISTVTDAKMDDLKTQVAAKKTDTEKMKLLQEQLKNDKIITDQVAYIMDWLNFESSKFDFVKWAYDITADKENYGMLDGKFTYKEYQDQFSQFMESKR